MATVSSPTTQKFNAVSFATADSGIIVGDSGTVISLIKSGDGWITRLAASPDPMKKNIRDIALAEASTYGLIIGDSGLIMRTLNRGARWTSYARTRVKYNLNGIMFRSYAVQIAVGDSGTLLKSTGTNVWSQKPIPENISPTTNFYSSSFFADSFGYVVGQYGVILKTVNTGETWGYKVSNVTSTLRSVFTSAGDQYNTNYAWAVGDDGVILKTTDQGDQWTKQTSGVPTTTLRRVAFVDSIRGFVFGDGGLVLATTNGGDDWTQQTSNSTSALNGSFFNYPDIQVVNMYAIEMRGIRKHFLSDVVLAAPEATIVNYDYITKVDTGLISFDPILLSSLPSYWYNYYLLNPIPNRPFVAIPEQLIGIFGFKDVPNINAGAFTIINSDSLKFSNHTKLGPGVVNVVNTSIGYITDSTKPFGIDWFRWNLLPSSEIRLVAYQYKVNVTTHVYLGYSKKTVDVVRWGNFMPTSWFLEGDSLYLGNQPAGNIPEWYSLSRYSDDIGKSNPSDLNTLSSFYMSKDPLPGWYSQKKKQ